MRQTAFPEPRRAVDRFRQTGSGFGLARTPGTSWQCRGIRQQIRRIPVLCDHRSGKEAGRPRGARSSARSAKAVRCLECSPIQQRLWSERPDSNRRPLDPQSSALPSCATLRTAATIETSGDRATPRDAGSTLATSAHPAARLSRGAPPSGRGRGRGAGREVPRVRTAARTAPCGARSTSPCRAATWAAARAPPPRRQLRAE